MALVSEKNNNICLEDLNLKYGIKIVKSALVKSMKEALDFTRISGFPVALKIESQDILHKTDIGGVVLNINSEEELKDSYNMINRSVKKNKPDAIIQGMIVQEMLKEGFELIIGYNNDSTYGPTLMLGMGGIFTEAIKDVVFRLLPIKPKDALEMIGSLKFSDILFKGFRNIPRVSRDMMADLICKVAEMALSIGKKIDSFDINPVIVWSDQYRVVDFKAVYSEKNKVLTTQIANTANLDIFFNSKNLALVGASDSKDKIGGLVLDSLIKNGYKGKIYPINPKYGSVMGLKAYKSVMDIPDQIDLAVFTISLARIPDILNDFDKKNIKNAVIISAGGKEIGETGIEEKIKEIAEVKEIRVIGPNCLGMFGGKSMIDTLFQPHEHMKRPDSGLISLISQSGTVGIAFLELLDGYGVSKFISYGNRIDVDEGDLIEYLAEDPLTRVISVYIEGLEKGRKFFNAVKKAAKIKPVIVYKAGRTPQASKAALSHTGFLTGTHNLIKGVMDQAGVIQEDSIEKLLATAKALSVYPLVRGNRALIITNGAGTTIQSIDKIVEQGRLQLAEMQESSIAELKELFPNHVIIGNPIDLTGTATDDQYEQAVKIAVKDQNVDIIMVWFVFQCKPITNRICSFLKKYKDKKPIICGAIGGEYTHKIGNLLDKKYIPIFYTVDEWVSAAGSLCHFK